MHVLHQAVDPPPWRRYSWFQGSLLQNDDQSRMKLVQVSGLKSGGSSNQTCMGMLVQMTQGEYWLVDASDSVKIDLSQQPQTSDGLFCEHMVVLVEGRMLDGVFVASVLILPKMESRAQSLKLQPTLSLTLYAPMKPPRNRLPTTSPRANLKSTFRPNTACALFSSHVTPLHVSRAALQLQRRRPHRARAAAHRQPHHRPQVQQLTLPHF